MSEHEGRGPERAAPGDLADVAAAEINLALHDAQARIRHAVLLRFMQSTAVAASLSLVAVLLVTSQQWTRLTAPVTLLVASLGGGAWYRTGRVEAASRLFLSICWVAILTGTIMNGGVQTPVVYAFTIVIVGTCALYGVRLAVLLSASTLVLIAVLASLEGTGWLPVPPGPVPTTGAVAVLASIIVILLTVTSVHVNLLTALLERMGFTQARLQASERRVRHILDAAAIPLCLVDARGVVVDFNPRFERRFGYGRADFSTIDEWAALAFPDPEGRHAVEEMRAAVRSKASEPGAEIEPRECKVTCRSGECRDVVVSGSVLEEGVLITFVDVTERRKAEAALRHREKMDAIGQLAGGVAHDFNNQLSGIIGYAEMLSLKPQDARSTAYLENILKAAQRAADLTQKLLAFSRKGPRRSIPQDLHATVAEVIAFLERSLDRLIQVRQELAAPASCVLGDPSMLENAVLNLALNARDAMAEGGVLTFSTRVTSLEPGAFGSKARAGRYIELRVADTGCGMTDEVKRHVFEPFFTTKTVGRGTGLGLASVFGTVRSHDGIIRFESAIGHGTTFHVYLPLHEPPALVASAAPAAARRAEGSARIMVVDDEEIVCNLVGDLLESLGYQTVRFTDGEEALAYYRDSAATVDLVLLDVVMPKMNGRRLFRALQAVNPRVRAILCSGFTAQGEGEEELPSGVLAFVPKPFDLITLARHVADGLKA